MKETKCWHRGGGSIFGNWTKPVGDFVWTKSDARFDDTSVTAAHGRCTSHANQSRGQQCIESAGRRLLGLAVVPT